MDVILPKTQLLNSIFFYVLCFLFEYFLTTNKERAMRSFKEDRRVTVIKSSDELSGDREFFDRFYGCLKDEKWLRQVVYELENREIKNDLKKCFKTTAFQEQIVLFESPFDRFIRDCVEYPSEITVPYYDRRLFKIDDEKECFSCRFRDFYDCYKNNCGNRTPFIAINAIVRKINEFIKANESLPVLYCETKPVRTDNNATYLYFYKRVENFEVFKNKAS
jgi:hypothetical protein